MFVFWWQGRGYQTIWIWLLTMCAFGIVAAIASPYIPDRPWYWGAAFCGAALANWKRGSALNASSLAKRRSSTVVGRLFYKARHRFMSLPMETFSLVLVVVGIGIAIQPMFVSAN